MMNDLYLEMYQDGVLDDSEWRMSSAETMTESEYIEWVHDIALANDLGWTEDDVEHFKNEYRRFGEAA